MALLWHKNLKDWILKVLTIILYEVVYIETEHVYVEKGMRKMVIYSGQASVA